VKKDEEKDISSYWITLGTIIHRKH